MRVVCVCVFIFVFLIFHLIGIETRNLNLSYFLHWLGLMEVVAHVKPLGTYAWLIVQNLS